MSDGHVFERLADPIDIGMPPGVLPRTVEGQVFLVVTLFVCTAVVAHGFIVQQGEIVRVEEFGQFDGLLERDLRVEFQYGAGGSHDGAVRAPESEHGQCSGVFVNGNLIDLVGVEDREIADVSVEHDERRAVAPRPEAAHVEPRIVAAGSSAVLRGGYSGNHARQCRVRIVGRKICQLRAFDRRNGRSHQRPVLAAVQESYFRVGISPPLQQRNFQSVRISYIYLIGGVSLQREDQGRFVAGYPDREIAVPVGQREHARFFVLDQYAFERHSGRVRNLPVHGDILFILCGGVAGAEAQAQ